MKTFVFYLHLFGLHVSHLVFIYLFKFLATCLAPPFENPAYATRTGVGNLYPLGCIWPAISNIHPRSLMWLPEVVGHAANLLWNYPNILRNLFFFLGSSTTNRPNWSMPFFIFIFFQMIPKRAKLYSNGVKIAIFWGKITNIAQNDPMASGGDCLVCDMLSCTSLLKGVA